VEAVVDRHMPTYRKPPEDEYGKTTEQWFHFGEDGFPRGRAFTWVNSPEEHRQACIVARTLWPKAYKASCGPHCPDQDPSAPMLGVVVDADDMDTFGE
jgi:hypothetical protein